MNNLHRYLDLPFEINKPEICNTTPTERFHSDLKDADNIEMIWFHDRLGLSINHYEVFFTPAGMSLPIHADTKRLNNRVKINITWGPEEGVIRWWKAKRRSSLFVASDGGKDGKTHREHKNVRADMKDCDFVYQANTNRPSLVNAGQLHDTYSPPHAGRWTLSFVPQVKGSSDRCLYWDDAIEYYKDYII